MGGVAVRTHWGGAWAALHQVGIRFHSADWFALGSAWFCLSSFCSAQLCPPGRSSPLPARGCSWTQVSLHQTRTGAVFGLCSDGGSSWWGSRFRCQYPAGPQRMGSSTQILRSVFMWSETGFVGPIPHLNSQKHHPPALHFTSQIAYFPK